MTARQVLVPAAPPSAKETPGTISAPKSVFIFSVLVCVALFFHVPWGLFPAPLAARPSSLASGEAGRGSGASQSLLPHASLGSQGAAPRSAGTSAAAAVRADSAAGDPLFPPRKGRTPLINASKLPSRGAGGGFLPGRHVGGPLDLQIVYLSRATQEGGARRASIRRTFSLLDASVYRVAYYWVLTPPADKEALEALRAENSTYGDIAWANPALQDPELTTKVWDEMRVGAAAPNAPPFWVKLDDDVLVLWERFMPVLYMEMPQEGLVWCSQGVGHQGIYCNGPYLWSMDVVRRLASDVGACCGVRWRRLLCHLPGARVQCALPRCSLLAPTHATPFLPLCARLHLSHPTTHPRLSFAAIGG
jgi:hypothetical protein